MKNNFYNIFELIADESIELLTDNSEIEKQLKLCTAEQTIQDVYFLIESDKNVAVKKKKRLPLKLRFLIAAIIILSMSTLSFALHNEGAQLLSDLSQSFIEAKEGFSVIIKNSNGEIVYGNESKLPNLNAWKSSNIIKSVKDDIMLPTSVKEFTTKKEGKSYLSSEIIFWNGDMIIFTKEDGSGWQLEEGDDIILQLEDISTNSTDKRYISFGYIYNGKLIETERKVGEVTEKFNLVADKKGEYYICIMNVGVTSISLKGNLKFQPSNY